VSDVDRAKAFYERIGFGNLHTQVMEAMRVFSTLPGSNCAIVFGTGRRRITDARSPIGSQAR
jgi:hypothetical protein